MRPQFCPELQAAGVVHREHLDGPAPDGRDTFYMHAPQQKVLCPPVTTRVKQRRHFSGPWVDPRQVWPLAEITPVASQGEIVGVFGPTVLFGNDVFHVVGQFAVLLAEQAVLATVVRPSPHKLPRGGVHPLLAIRVQMPARLEFQD